MRRHGPASDANPRPPVQYVKNLERDLERSFTPSRSLVETDPILGRRDDSRFA